MRGYEDLFFFHFLFLKASSHSSGHGKSRNYHFPLVQLGSCAFLDNISPAVLFASLRTEDECWYAQAQSVSSPLLPPCQHHHQAPAPPRIAVPTSRHFPDYDWCAPDRRRASEAAAPAGGNSYYGHPAQLPRVHVEHAVVGGQVVPVAERDEAAAAGAAAGRPRSGCSAERGGLGGLGLRIAQAVPS